MTPLEQTWQEIAAEAETIRQGGGAAAIEKQHAKQRLTARERLELLVDPHSSPLELGLWQAYGMYGEWGGAPAAGVICAVGMIAGRHHMIIANDATVKAGAFFPATAKKVLRAQRIARDNRLPLVYLVDSAGIFLPLQEDVFPDEDDFGRIFRNNAVLSAEGIPQLAAIMGNCVAGGGYLPVLCDKILMVEGSGLYLAGPALVKSAIGQEVSSEELGGAAMHAAISGTIDYRDPDDKACLQRIRRLAGDVPPDSQPTVVKIVGSTLLVPPEIRPSNTNSRTSEIYSVITGDPRQSYDVRDLLDCIVDTNSFEEYKAEFGKTLCCGTARIGGQAVGIVANQRQRVKTAKGELQFGGVIYVESAEKAARFVLDCNQQLLPIIFLQDVNGFMVGRDSERAGIIKAGAKLVNAVSNSRVPKITIITGGSYGAGNYALCGKAFDPRFIFAWPGSRTAVMGADQATNTLVDVVASKLKREGKSPDEEEIQALRERVAEDYARQTDVRYAAARGWVDAIIEPAQTRDVLIESLAIAARHVSHEPWRLGVFQT